MATTGVVLLEELELRNGRKSPMLDLVDAIASPPQLTLTMTGACTLTVQVADGDRKLTRSPLISEKSWSQVLGIRFELVAVSKAGDRVTLTYEDGVTAALRRRDDKLKIPAGSSTRTGIIERLARGIPHEVDPQKRRNVARVVERSAKNDTWDLSGDLAEEVHWRRFSTGTKLIFGSDEWLYDRLKPITFVERRGPVNVIDFDLDQGKRASRATVYLNAAAKAVPPGQPVLLGDDMGPAAGKWLVESFTRNLSSPQATVTLTRERHSLKEPKREAGGESGERDFLPGVGNGTDTGGKAATAAREAMVQFALAQRGKAYVYGASGPDAYDCSGLVQAATAHAGHTLPKPSASQIAAIQAAGKSMSVDTAIRTRGAFLFRAGSPSNHIVISLGNGSTIEAMGSAYGVCIGSAAGRGWTAAGWWI